MKITHHWNITKENGTRYTKYFLDNGKVLELGETSNDWTLKGKSGRRINNEDSVHQAIKLVSPYYDELSEKE